MHYEAILMDQDKGNFHIGSHKAPQLAILDAFQRLLRMEIDSSDPFSENVESRVNNLTKHDVSKMFRLADMNDPYLSEAMSVTSDISQDMIIVRFDRNQETMYSPCGILRIKL